MPLSQLATQGLGAAAVLGVLFLFFGALGRLFPCNPNHRVFVSRAIGLDLRYCLFGVVYGAAGPAAAALVGEGRHALVASPLSGQPLWLQVALVLVLTDLAQYWIHRAFHSRRLWPFHVIHHAAEEVNWTTAFRAHPVNYLASNVSLALAARLAGFSETALLLASPVFFLSGALVHANLDWTFGPFRFVFASPVFHRWHHSAEAQRRDRNFAPMFPIWDLAFGTFEMPAGRLPDGFGADPLPDGLVRQLVHPFARPSARRRRDREFA